MRRELATFSVLFFLALPAVLSAQPATPTPTPEQAELIERILELRRQIDELLEQLPPHLRDAAMARRAEGPPPRSAPPTLPETASETATRLGGPRWHRRGCDALAVFDTDGDGSVSPLDRYFRHFYLWVDRDGNRRPDERELTSTYEEKVREIAVDLGTFVGGKRGFLGEIRFGEHVELDLRGNGFGGADDAVLVVDASALRRGGGPELLAPDGESLEGYQPFGRGLRIRGPDGEITRLDCR